jgi:hypothetical protein
MYCPGTDMHVARKTIIVGNVIEFRNGHCPESECCDVPDTQLSRFIGNLHFNVSHKFQAASLILYITSATVLYTQVYFQQTAQYLVLVQLHVSAMNCSHLQGATVFEDTHSALCNLLV